MRERDDDELPDAVAEAVALLREEPAVRPEWRAQLLRRAIAGREPLGRSGLTFSVPAAIAAAAMFMVAGGAMALLATHRAPATVEAISSAPTAAVTAPSAAILPVRFSLVAPEAATVSIVGDFNQWNPATLPMRRSADGRLWEIEVRLPLGRYSYAFLIDGKLAPDPAAPRGAGDDFGKPNSVLMVRGS
jgi:hypothetical protein